MGKFGGREMNYHSDLDIVFLYEADGQTAFDFGRAAGRSTSNQHFFSELGQRIIKTASRLSPHGRLYEVDARLRPTGKSGALATSLAEFSRYFAEGHGPALGAAGPVQGPAGLRLAAGRSRAAMAAVHRAAFGHRWRRKDADEIRHMRLRLEETAAAGDLKRGPGGIVDIEFLVQMLQLQHAPQESRASARPTRSPPWPTCTRPGCSTPTTTSFFDTSYRFLRTIEGRLRLMNSTARDNLPQDPTELNKLAHLLHYGSSEALLADYENATRQIRRRFDELFDAAGG